MSFKLYRKQHFTRRVTVGDGSLLATFELQLISASRPEAVADDAGQIAFLQAAAGKFPGKDL